MKNFLVLGLLVLFSMNLFPQASPPGRINYQGVLRDSSGNPLNGDFEMVFRFYNAPSGGTLLWEETYNLTYPPQINISNGLFSVQLGDISHKTAGSETSFTDVFSKYTDVYLSVQVGSDSEMVPRIKVISSAFSENASTLDGRNSTQYAKLDFAETINANWLNTKYPWSDDEVSDVLTIGAGSTIDPTIAVGNSDKLDGFDSSYFLNTSSTPQTKSGKITINEASDYGIISNGYLGGGLFYDNSNTGIACTACGDYGIEANGTSAGGYFYVQNNSGQAYVGYPNYGIYSRGNTAGGYFKDLNSSGYAYVGYSDYGIDARGNEAGGYFKDLNGSGFSYVGYGDFGIEGFGNFAGAYFKDAIDSGSCFLGYGHLGLSALGNEAGGYFQDFDSSGEAYIGYGDYGIDARGNYTGGYFEDLDGSGYAYVGAGDYGIDARGNYTGGYFRDLDGSGYALVGYGDYGIDARGNIAGGYFQNLASLSYAYIAGSAFGAEAYGGDAGAYFKDLYQSGKAYIGRADNGIEAYGNTAGGYFEDSNSSSYGQVGYSTYKIQGTGTVSFVQNHPLEKDKVIVYAAPEGDEVATYTRGTAKLINGEARVKLSETFKWVTNPDIGLTAHLTPREKPVPLAIAYLSTEELVVKGSEDIQFDYIVYGLRIGFEESSIVQEKQEESYIPSFKDHRERYAKYPELKKYNALERFKVMESNVKGISPEQIDLKNAIALKEAIHEYDPEKDPPVENILGHKNLDKSENMEIKEEISKEERRFENQIKEERREEIKNEKIIEKPIELKEELSCFKTKEAAEEGDLVVLSKTNGTVELCREFFDLLVLGVISNEKMCGEGEVYVKTSGIAYLKVDASFGEIKRGDLIVTSITPGYGMKSDSPAQGTVLGKAIEDLKEGKGKIKVLIGFK